MNAYIVTADAIAEYLRADPEWCRLSNAFHSVSLPITKDDSGEEDPTYRGRKDNARGELEKLENELVNNIFWAVAQHEIPVMLLANERALQLSDLYLDSPELRTALMSGVASKLRLSSRDAAWSGARLAFSIKTWQRWLSLLSFKTGIESAKPTFAQLDKWLRPIVDRVVQDGKQLKRPQFEELIRKYYPAAPDKDIHRAWSSVAPESWRKASQGRLSDRKIVTDLESYLSGS